MEELDLITNKVNEMFAPHEVWAVGGCVRDSILGRQPKDYDFCTELWPDEVEAIIREHGRKPYLIGKKFGTVGFKLPLLEMKELSLMIATNTYEVGTKTRYQYIEVTTFRSETYEPNNRKPTVDFVTELKDDLSRRDFGMNAIGYRKGDFFDPFGGRLDILAKKVKAVGEATDRFSEDPLRMLRTARFVAQLGFEADPNLVGKTRKMCEKILTISRERWMQELDKLLVQEDFSKGLRVLYDTYLLKYLLPEVHLLWQTYGAPSVVEPISTAAPIAVDRWVALLSRIGRPYVTPKETRDGRIIYANQHLIALELAKGIALRLKWSNDRRDYVLEKLQSASD